jgi:hypothetical protein
MTTNRASTVRTLSIGLVLLAATVSLPTVSQAATGSVSLVLTKGGLIVGLSGGRGVLTFRGRHYKFKISGMSVGATIGASTTKLVGKAKNLQAPGDIAGSYSTLGASGAVAGGVGAVRLKNKKGVILELGGPQVGLELSAAVGGIRITME